jgi:hypothetical protein
MSSASASPTPSEPRRFSIRMPRPLWIGLTAAALILISVGLRVGIPIYRHQVAIQEVERLGGLIGVVRSRIPESLRKRDVLREPPNILLDEATTVGFNNNASLSDASMSRLAGLTGLQELSLMGTRVTDSGLAVVTGMPALKKLWLDNTQVTDAGLVYLNGLTNLERLSLNGTRVSDSGLVHLKGLSSLQWLELNNTSVTDAEVAELRRALPGLKIDK